MCIYCRPGRRVFGKALLGAGLVMAAQAAGPARAARKLAAGMPLIMIDPGHGGHDPGAIAPDGVFEKTITLASGFALRHSLLATGRYRVRMTRQSDVFVTLEGRVAAAVAANADLFIALHCDHLPRPDLRGASVFTLSGTASDGLAASLANDENSSDQFGGPGIPKVSPQVAAILASLETRATRVSAATLAEDIQNSFKGVVPLLPDPTRSANFAVLRDPSTPSTLLEMGCLTNPLDERLLTSPKHRMLMADRLTSAIDRYFRDFAGNRDASAGGIAG
jgi:N-acetylmuramoyl-L-alanine amidase